MNLRDTFLFGLKTGVRQWRIAAIVYAIQVCLAVVLGMQVYEVLKASIGQSLELKKLLEGYDHTVFTDFLNIHGASITPLIGQLRWLIPVWLLFSAFLNGGLLRCAAEPETASPRSFWQGGAGYFFPFLKIGLFFTVLALVWTLVLWLPVAAMLESALERLPSEIPVVWGVLFLLLVWLTGLGGLFIWSVLSRLHYIRAGQSLAGSLRGGGRRFRGNKTRYWALLVLFAALQLLLTAGYWVLEAQVGMISAPMVLVFFVVQQTFVFARMLARQMMYVALAVDQN